MNRLQLDPNQTRAAPESALTDHLCAAAGPAAACELRFHLRV